MPTTEGRSETREHGYQGRFLLTLYNSISGCEKWLGESRIYCLGIGSQVLVAGANRIPTRIGPRKLGSYLEGKRRVGCFSCFTFVFVKVSSAQYRSGDGELCGGHDMAKEM